MANKLRKIAITAGLGAMTMMPQKSSAQIPKENLTEIIPAEIMLDDNNIIAKLDSCNNAKYDTLITQLIELREKIVIAQRLVIIFNADPSKENSEFANKLWRDYGKTLELIDSAIKALTRSSLTYKLNVELYNKQCTR